MAFLIVITNAAFIIRVWTLGMVAMSLSEGYSTSTTLAATGPVSPWTPVWFLYKIKEFFIIQVWLLIPYLGNTVHYISVFHNFFHHI